MPVRRIPGMSQRRWESLRSEIWLLLSPHDLWKSTTIVSISIVLPLLLIPQYSIGYSCALPINSLSTSQNLFNEALGKQKPGFLPKNCRLSIPHGGFAISCSFCNRHMWLHVPEHRGFPVRDLHFQEFPGMLSGAGDTLVLSLLRGSEWRVGSTCWVVIPGGVPGLP